MLPWADEITCTLATAIAAASAQLIGQRAGSAYAAKLSTVTFVLVVMGSKDAPSKAPAFGTNYILLYKDVLGLSGWHGLQRWSCCVLEAIATLVAIFVLLRMEGVLLCWMLFPCWSRALCKRCQGRFLNCCRFWATANSDGMMRASLLGTTVLLSASVKLPHASLMSVCIKSMQVPVVCPIKESRLGTHVKAQPD